MGEVYAKCCGGDSLDSEAEINTEVRGKNDAKTIDMEGYENKIEINYDGFICTYTPDDGGSFHIGIKAEANDIKWSKKFASADYEENLEEIQQNISVARDEDKIKGYMYEDNPTYHAAVGNSNLMEDYPLLVDIDGQFTFLLPRDGDATKYILNGDRTNVKLLGRKS